MWQGLIDTQVHKRRIANVNLEYYYESPGYIMKGSDHIFGAVMQLKEVAKTPKLITFWP